MIIRYGRARTPVDTDRLCVKMTDSLGYTRGGWVQFEPGVWRDCRDSRSLAEGQQPELCTGQAIHFYQHPVQWQLFKSMHGSSGYKSAWLGEWAGTCTHHADKSGSTKFRVLRRMSVKDHLFKTGEQVTEFSRLMRDRAAEMKRVTWAWTPADMEYELIDMYSLGRFAIELYRESTAQDLLSDIEWSLGAEAGSPW